MSKKMLLFTAIILITLFLNNAFVLGAAAKSKPAANLLFPQGSPPAETVDVVDIILSSDNDKLVATTLQGLINSGPRSRVYLLLAKHMNDAFWLKYMQEKGYVRKVANISFDEYLNKYSSHFNSVIVYDPNLLSTINIATMIASIQKAIVISPAHMTRFDNNKIIDLREKWKTNVEAYEWAFKNLWPEMNHKVLCCYHPVSIPHHLRDYLLRNRIFTFWITGEKAQDGKVSSYEAEKRFAEKLFANTAANVPVIGFWYSEMDAGINEYTGVGLAGLYGKLTVPCDWATNMSFLSGVRVNFGPLVSEYQRQIAQHRKPHTLDKTKVYVCFDIVDSGDAPVYWPAAQFNVWNDPKRGSVPVNYSLGPVTMELMPPVLQWYYENATPNDYLYMGLSGACYAAPYRDLMSKTNNPDAAWKEYLGLTQQYMDRLGLKEISLYTNAWRVFDRSTADVITLKFAENLDGLDSLILGMGRDEHITQKSPNYFLGKNNILVSHVVTRWDPNNIGRNEKNNAWLAEEIRRNTPVKRPAFIHVHPLSWSYYPSDLLAVLEKLGNEYMAISLHDYRELYLLRLSNVNGTTLKPILSL